METLRFRIGDIELYAKAEGSPGAPVIILLHGFPEFWRAWHNQIDPLASAGFRVIVPDQRGYNLSSKPQDMKSYAVRELASDVIGIADELKQEQVFLAGHDWGAAVAWASALLYPKRVAKLAILNVPHPSIMNRHLQNDPQQIRRSWYICFFQLPRLPEMLFRAWDYRLGTLALQRSSRRGTFSREALDEYRAAWSQPGALTGMIHWYRAALRYPTPFADCTVRVPTRILWGERDTFLGAEMAEESLRYCASGELIRFPRASHWLQHEEPEEVSRCLIEFFRRASG